MPGGGDEEDGAHALDIGRGRAVVARNRLRERKSVRNRRPARPISMRKNSTAISRGVVRGLGQFLATDEQTIIFLSDNIDARTREAILAKADRSIDLGAAIARGGRS